MSTPYFRFKQFTVWHDRCAMKVGTDGVLLGAWAGEAKSSSVRRILDIGTGSGLIALMLAQRFPNAMIDGIDIAPSAIEQAQDNFSASPFCTRLRAHSSSLQEWQPKEKYDLIVSNPPYFSNSLLCPEKIRSNARHDSMLSFTDLLVHSCRMLSLTGTLALVLPADAETSILAEARLSRLYCVRLCRIRTTASKCPKRILIAFSRQTSVVPIVSESLCLSDDGASRSAAYSALTQDFYL